MARRTLSVVALAGLCLSANFCACTGSGHSSDGQSPGLLRHLRQLSRTSVSPTLRRHRTRAGVEEGAEGDVVPLTSSSPPGSCFR